MSFHVYRITIGIVTVLLLQCSRLAGCSRHLFDHTELPKFADSDVLEVYHLRSFPLQLITTSIGTFSTQTSGLAMRSRSSNEPVVLQFRPKSFANCFLPKIRYSTASRHRNESRVVEGADKTLNVKATSDSERNLVLDWDKEAEIIYSNEIDTHYWQQSTFLAHINGVVYKDYVLWIEGFHVRNQLFSPQSICSGEYEENCYTHSMTWDTFVEESIQVLASLSVRINAIIPPRASELRFLSAFDPVEVTVDRKTSPRESMLSEKVELMQENSPGTIEDEQSVHRSRQDPLPTNFTDASAMNMSLLQEDLLTYYRDLMSCMQEFQLGDFCSVLKSCSSENIAFIHIEGDQYYRITPRFPYVYVNEYLQTLPEPLFLGHSNIDVIDWAVCAMLITLLLSGLYAVLVKTQIIGQTPASMERPSPYRPSVLSQIWGTMRNAYESTGGVRVWSKSNSRGDYSLVQAEIDMVEDCESPSQFELVEHKGLKGV